jgi:hypothetical protein
MRIIAYTYGADYHCIDCTTRNKKFQRTLCIHYIQGKPCNNCRDSNGLLYEQKDNDGNLVHPLFSTDEWQELDPSFLEDNPTQYLACGDCHKTIDEYTVESEVTA